MDYDDAPHLVAFTQVPPADPWLAGYAVSYYYGGYYIISQLAQITATPASVAYNLGLATIFATAATTAFGVFYDLVGQQYTHQARVSPWKGVAWSLAGVTALLVFQQPGWFYSLVRAVV